LLTLGKYYDSFKLPIQWHEAWLRGNLNPLLDGQIAQPVEHSPEKAGVVGSIPTLTTLKSPGISLIQRTWAFYFNPENDNIDTNLPNHFWWRAFSERLPPKNMDVMKSVY
jgi:hypothetical protein